MASLPLVIGCCIGTFVAGFVLALICKHLKAEIAKASAYMAFNLGLLLQIIAMALNDEYVVAWYCNVFTAGVDSTQKTYDSVSREVVKKTFGRVPLLSKIPSETEDIRRKANAARYRVIEDRSGYRSSNA